MCSNDKEKVLQILYLLDKFGLGDKFYRELAPEVLLYHGRTESKGGTECRV